MVHASIVCPEYTVQNLYSLIIAERLGEHIMTKASYGRKLGMKRFAGRGAKGFFLLQSISFRMVHRTQKSTP